ncbi:MAG: L,D-transpeptidase family protein [Patescibacteria group bacterium]
MNIFPTVVIRYLFLGTLVLGGVLVLPSVTQAGFTHTPDVVLYQNNEWQSSFAAYATAFTGGVQVAVGDVTGDGDLDIITAAGPGGAPHIRIFDKSGNPLKSFFAYDLSMRSGVNIAVGDLNHDGIDEIITAPRYKAAPHVRVFDMNGQPQFTPGFFAYDDRFRGGVNVAVGDVDGDGYGEIITGPGAGGGPHVRVFDRYGTVTDNIFPFHPDYRGGVTVGTANVDGGAEDEVIVAVQGGDAPWVKVLKRAGYNFELKSFLAFGEAFRGGVRIVGADVDDDGLDEVVAAAGAGGGPQVVAYEGYGKAVAINFFAYATDFRGGVNVSAGDFNGDGRDEIVTGPSSWLAEGKVEYPRYVLVDLSEQRLYAFEYGRLVNDFLVSTGLPSTPTRPGTFQVSQKIYSHLYAGPDYYLPNTLYNLRFDGPRFLHGAYWHNNFGHPMSHGCVNIHYSDAAWIYNWMNVGDTVIVQN